MLRQRGDSAGASQGAAPACTGAGAALPSRHKAVHRWRTDTLATRLRAHLLDPLRHILDGVLAEALPSGTVAGVAGIVLTCGTGLEAVFLARRRVVRAATILVVLARACDTAAATGRARECELRLATLVPLVRPAGCLPLAQHAISAALAHEGELVVPWCVVLAAVRGAAVKLRSVAVLVRACCMKV